MDARATVRVRTPEGSNQGPDRSQMERAAELLQECGFNILRIGRMGVNVQADETVFSRELGVNPTAEQSLLKTPAPRSDELSELIDLVEIAGKPINF